VTSAVTPPSHTVWQNALAAFRYLAKRLKAFRYLAKRLNGVSLIRTRPNAKEIACRSKI
jgi:hypothetical protein